MKSWAALVTVMLGVAPLAQQADRTSNPLANRPDAADAGHRLYDQTCQSCHGPAGQGDRGPALNSGSFARGGEDADLFHTIRAGVPGSQMPPFAGLTDEQTWQLVTYIRSLAAERGPQQGSPPQERESFRRAEGDPAEGERLFFGTARCASCHQVNGRGGIVGPDLSTAGRTPVATLRGKILPTRRVAPVEA